MFAELTSLFSGRKVDRLVARNGEVPLRSLVLPIGG
ncbi:MAG TPA: hypothetical protein P5016_18075 [Verrucomicrobiales bacterium]|nr:hypothetical protein [Verrucomicrobiales bacterium]